MSRLVTTWGTLSWGLAVDHIAQSRRRLVTVLLLNGPVSHFRGDLSSLIRTPHRVPPAQPLLQFSVIADALAGDFPGAT